MSKFILAVLLAFTLTGCFPPNDNVTDPTPVIPDPIEVVSLFDGDWTGAINFVNTDGFGNEETQSLGISASVFQNPVTVVNGTLVFDTGVAGEPCSLDGGQVEIDVLFVVVCPTGDRFNPELEFHFYGELSEGVLNGGYDAPRSGSPIRDGVFTLVFVGTVQQ